MPKTGSKSRQETQYTEPVTDNREKMNNNFIATTRANEFWNPETGALVEVKPVGYDKARPVYGIPALDEAPKIWDACEVVSERPIHGAYQECGAYPYIRTYKHAETGATYEAQIYK